MPNSETVAIPEAVTDVITETPSNVIFLTVEDKLAVREARVSLLTAKDNIRVAVEKATQADKSLVALLNNMATKMKLNPNEYLFNIDNLSFQPKTK